jgi:hypothetical protein
MNCHLFQLHTRTNIKYDSIIGMKKLEDMTFDELNKEYSNLNGFLDEGKRALIRIEMRKRLGIQ